MPSGCGALRATSNPPCYAGYKMARRALRKLALAPTANPARARATLLSVTVLPEPSEPEEPGPSNAVAAPTRQRGPTVLSRNINNEPSWEGHLPRIHNTIHAERLTTIKRGLCAEAGRVSRLLPGPGLPRWGQSYREQAPLIPREGGRTSPTPTSEPEVIALYVG